MVDYTVCEVTESDMTEHIHIYEYLGQVLCFGGITDFFYWQLHVFLVGTMKVL